MLKNRDKMVKLLFLLSLVISINSYGHGEDMLGPHGGYIRMPAAFHTEVIVDNKNNLRVFLLDMEWKNPSVKGASILMLLNNKFKAKCVVKDNFYQCYYDSAKVDLSKKGKLEITAKREGQVGMKVVYQLPLSL